MKKEKGFIISFLIIIYGVLGCYILKQALISLNIIPLIRTDNWQFYENKPGQDLRTKLENKLGSLKVNISNRANNYFPFYIPLMESYEAFNYQTNALFYKNIPIKTNTDKEYLFYNANYNFYYYETFYNEQELNERLAKQINFFNNLAQNDYEIYIYLPNRYELTTLKNNNLHTYVDTFKKKLTNKIKVEELNITNYDNYLTYFYKTDHHWNIYGAIKGYRDILKMLGKKPINSFKIKTDATKYYGSLAKTALNTQIYDTISDLDLKLEYDCLVNNKKPDNLFKPRVIPSNKTNKYYDYYVAYFNGQYGNVIYDYHQPKEENLLILCDSFAWQIDYLIASSFNQTHVINLRYDDYKNNNFNLTEYMHTHNINKVLFLYESGSTLFDQYNYDFGGRVK